MCSKEHSHQKSVNWMWDHEGMYPELRECSKQLYWFLVKNHVFATRRNQYTCSWQEVVTYLLWYRIGSDWWSRFGQVPPSPPLASPSIEKLWDNLRWIGFCVIWNTCWKVLMFTTAVNSARITASQREARHKTHCSADSWTGNFWYQYTCYVDSHYKYLQCESSMA